MNLDAAKTLLKDEYKINYVNIKNLFNLNIKRQQPLVRLD